MFFIGFNHGGIVGMNGQSLLPTVALAVFGSGVAIVVLIALRVFISIKMNLRESDDR